MCRNIQQKWLSDAPANTRLCQVTNFEMLSDDKAPFKEWIFLPITFALSGHHRKCKILFGSDMCLAHCLAQSAPIRANFPANIESELSEKSSFCRHRSQGETRLSSGESAAGSVCANLPIPQSENVPVGNFVAKLFLQGGDPDNVRDTLTQTMSEIP